MNSYTVAELGRRPGAILSEAEPTLITNNGRVQNLVINVSGLDVDEAVGLARGIRGQLALRRLRASAQPTEDELTLDDIEAEVAAVREVR